MKKVPFASYLAYLFFVGWMALDMWSKAWVEAHLNHSAGSRFDLPGSVAFIIPGYFALTHVKNTGGAWSVLSGHVPWLAMVAAVVAVFILGYERHLERPRIWQSIGLGLLLAGTVGNLVDRLRFGQVTDMFDLQWHGRNIFPIFNVADIGIDVGIGILLIFGSIASRASARRVRRF